MNKFVELAERFCDWFFDRLASAEAGDRARFVEAAKNPREVSQRIHWLEQANGAFHV